MIRFDQVPGVFTNRTQCVQHTFLLILCATLFLLVGCGPRKSPAPVGELGISSSERQGLHTVRSGDTLFSIAWRYGLDFNQIADWNGIEAPYRIFPGQALKISEPSRARSQPSRDQQIAAASRPQDKAKPPRQKASAPTKPTPPPKPKIEKKIAKPTSARTTREKVFRGRGVVQWIWPTKGPILRTFSTRVTGRKGLDIGGKRGQAIKASAAGKVVYSGSGLVGYGRLIIIKHNDKYLSAYGHNDALLVKEGQIVSAGTTIAKMGLVEKRPQLHFEIRKDGRPVNPQKYLPRR